MVLETDLSSFDLRYESYRMRNPVIEARVLASILERGIEEPLEGVDVGERRILLNGFKRYRSARKLCLSPVPYVTLGEDEAAGIIAILRASNRRGLSIIEEARFIDDLKTLHRLSVAEIAELLSRSKSWVNMRLGLLAQLSEKVREKVLSGAFPLYSYMYTLRHLMRRNGTRREDVDDFVVAVAGKKLSVREIEQLAHGYFRGPEWFRREVESGNFSLVLDRMKQVPDSPEGSNDVERVLLRDLEIVGKYMQRVVVKSQHPRLGTRAFSAEANLLVGGILSRLGGFHQAMRTLHDRTGQT